MIMFSECQKKNRSINGKIIDNHQVKTAIVKERWRDDAVSLQVIQNLFFNRTLQKQKHLNCFSSCPHVEPNTFSLPNYVTSGMKEEETCRSDTAAENHRHWVERPGFPDVKPPLSEYFVTFCSSVSLSRVPHLTYAHIAFSPYFQKFIYIQPSCPLNLLGPFFCGVTKLDQLLVAWFRLQQASFGHHCKSEELRLTPPPSSARVSETLPHPQTSSVHHDKPCASAASSRQVRAPTTVLPFTSCTHLWWAPSSFKSVSSTCKMRMMAPTSQSQCEDPLRHWKDLSGHPPIEYPRAQAEEDGRAKGKPEFHHATFWRTHSRLPRSPLPMTPSLSQRLPSTCEN